MGNCGKSEARKEEKAKKKIKEGEEKYYKILQAMVSGLLGKEHEYSMALEAKILEEYAKRQNQNLEEKLATASSIQTESPLPIKPFPSIPDMKEFVNKTLNAEISSLYALEDDDFWAPQEAPKTKDKGISREEIEEAFYGPALNDPAWVSKPGYQEKMKWESEGG